MTSELLAFLTTRLTETASFEEIRKIAELAIQSGMKKSAEDKKNWVFDALSELYSLDDTTIALKKIILQAIEVVMLSRRISDTGKKGIFGRKVIPHANHMWSIEGAKLLISTLYPKLPIEYVTISDRKENNVSNIIESLKRNTSIWVVIGYVNNYHLSLMRLTFIEENLQVQLIDSIGICTAFGESKFTTSMTNFLRSITAALEDPCCSTSVAFARQKDGVNCFSFLLSDLEVAEAYLAEGTTYFFKPSKKIEAAGENFLEVPLLPEFSKISQVNASRENCTMAIDLTSEKLGNPDATKRSIGSLESLIEKGKLTFKSENHIEEGDSDVDQEIDECCVM